MTKSNAGWAAFLVASLAASGSALAQSPDDPSQTNTNDPAQQTNTEPTPAPAAQQPQMIVVTPPPPAPIIIQPERGKSDMERVGFSLSAGGGVTDFTSQTMRDTTSVGGMWAVRATVGTKVPLGFEGSYFGSAQQINALGIDNDAMLVSNGLQGALRLNAVVGSPVTPFLFGGVAWSHYDLTNTITNTSAISDTDNLLEIPVGLGIGGSYRGLGYDLRGEMRFATQADLVPELSAGRELGSRADMHRWGVNATLGYGF